MRLHVHRSGKPFLEALRSSEGAYYAIFARATLDALVLREAETIACERAHHDLVTASALRTAAEALLRDFFDRAARGDRERRYSYSSRVLLAVADYPDVALLFLLRALKSQQPGSTVHALVEDAWQAALVRFEVEGGAKPVFRAQRRRGMARGARSLARLAFSTGQPRECNVLLFTLGDNVARGAPDAYFGDLAATLAEKRRVLTVYAAPGARVRFPTLSDALPLETFLAPLDPLRIAGARDDALAPSNADAALVDYLRACERASGEVFMQALMAKAFDRMFAALKPSTAVYPFENRTWEKHFLHAARRHGVHRCVGYQHSSITPRHLALSGEAALADLPDTIITCGEITAALVGDGMPNAKALVAVGAALRARRLKLASPLAWGLLAPISSSRAEAWEILRLLHALAGADSTPVIVRTHPTIPIDDLYAQFDWPAHVRLSRGQTLADDFAAASLVAYSSSTVALEGMLYGRLPVYLDIGDIPSGNPIHGEHDFLFRAGSGQELRDTIARIRAYSGDELTALRARARAYAERYLVEPTPENVRRMVERIVQC